VSNSGDRPVVRRNLIWGNHSCGLHMNGDASQGGDGVISDALVERNVIFDNGNGDPAFGAPGGSAINCDGVQDSVIRNNLLWNDHKTGIALYRIDGGGPAAATSSTATRSISARSALGAARQRRQHGQSRRATTCSSTTTPRTARSRSRAAACPASAATSTRSRTASRSTTPG
jgi:hypothetical protein